MLTKDSSENYFDYLKSKFKTIDFTNPDLVREAFDFFDKNRFVLKFKSCFIL